MAPKRRIIIDTDPGNDDVIAMLLALAAPASELEVVLISVVEGNVDVRACVRNVVAIFHVLDEEIKWRKSQNLPAGFEGCTKYKPLVAIGANEPLHDKSDNADYFHGTDGLGGSTVTHPEFNPHESWKRLFEEPPPDDELTKTASDQVKDLEDKPFSNFTTSRQPAHKEILRLLRENEAETISIVSIGPLTNLALAAAEDPETFLRAKEVISMGGAIDAIGNVTPNAEFNVWADPHAAARVYALSSAIPSSTMPSTVENYAGQDLPAYPPHLSKTLRVVLMALDITEEHTVSKSLFQQKSGELCARGSPLAKWMQAFLNPMLDKMASLHHGHDNDATLALHDPLCIYYVLTQDDPKWKSSSKSPEDIRVECTGQWTRGMTVNDRRPRKRRDSDGEAPHDRGNWLGNKSGNRIERMLESPGKDECGAWILDRILGYVQ
ncbi:hypothetical protein H2198_002570 [Neophaeococcomyces mojaviensis]|uniref:Uncharacterized protein n=1 Tax=Neophaeococcomyces mojaviensis TaxID=3383035 RepID=A0ACC3ADV6_9EURO|nr:hypothetical protein H2198_002570 [Knufia sp. JES_112]